MSPRELRELAAREAWITVERAGEILGVPCSTAYALAKRDEFPVPVVKVSRRHWFVATAHLVGLLGLDRPTQEGVGLRAVP